MAVGEEKPHYDSKSGLILGECQVACHKGAVLLSVDGEEEVEVRCEACHESETLPPSHEVHLAEGLVCDSCHSLSFQEIHDGEKGIVAFSGGAILNGYEPRFDGHTCSATYCHGAMAGAHNPNPTWGASLEIDSGTTNRCLMCHDPHADPENIETEGRCQTCHEIVDGEGQIQNKPEHINGEVKAKKECDDCHGTAEDPSSLPGSHVKHLESTMISPAITCDDCHEVPERVLQRGHVIDSDGDIRFGDRVLTLSENWPEYVHGVGGCLAVGCHDPRGPENGSYPIWGDISREGNECRVCHAPHESEADRPRTQNQCGACHSETAGEEESIQEGTATHIDNQVEGVHCGECHQVLVPPRVGEPILETPVHQKHLGRDRFLNPPPTCDDCHHPIPTDIFSPKHFDGEADVKFGPRGESRTGFAHYDSEIKTCTDVGCHNGASVGSNDGNEAGVTCTTCHPDKGPEHHFGLECNTCHESDVEDHISRNRGNE